MLICGVNTVAGRFGGCPRASSFNHLLPDGYLIQREVTLRQCQYSLPRLWRERTGGDLGSTAREVNLHAHSGAYALIR